MSMTSESWAKWFVELGRTQNTLTNEVVRSWTAWAKARSETLKSAGVDPRFQHIVAQIVQLGHGVSESRAESTVSGESIVAIEERLEKLEATVARLNAESTTPKKGRSQSDQFDAPDQTICS